ncbi:MAG: phosphate ABC transporter permease subunit PstC [Nitrospirales bacterium]|nr:phosphate ABC transporter permease subunit PstC [Nitrospirales bacterium]
MILLPNITLSPSRVDQLLVWILQGLAAFAGILVLLIVGFLMLEAFPAVRQIGFLSFFSDASWHPVEGFYNVMAMVWGSLLAMLGAVLLATPLGICSAVFCHFYAPTWFVEPYRKLIELLAGIPSVVYGLWGLVVLVPLIGQLHPPGPSLLAGISILTIMILPTIALMADASLAKVPSVYLRGAIALGLSRWTTIRCIIIPAATSGLSTGIILGIGRAIGETMAMLMVCGNVVQVPTNLFDPMRTLTANIALEMAYAVEDHRAALFFTGFLLLGVVIVMVLAVDYIKQRHTYA